MFLPSNPTTDLRGLQGLRREDLSGLAGSEHTVSVDSGGPVSQAIFREWLAGALRTVHTEHQWLEAPDSP